MLGGPVRPSRQASAVAPAGLVVGRADPWHPRDGCHRSSSPAVVPVSGAREAPSVGALRCREIGRGVDPPAVRPLLRPGTPGKAGRPDRLRVGCAGARRIAGSQLPGMIRNDGLRSAPRGVGRSVGSRSRTRAGRRARPAPRLSRRVATWPIVLEVRVPEAERRQEPRRRGRSADRGCGRGIEDRQHAHREPVGPRHQPRRMHGHRRRLHQRLGLGVSAKTAPLGGIGLGDHGELDGAVVEPRELRSQILILFGTRVAQGRFAVAPVQRRPQPLAPLGVLEAQDTPRPRVPHRWREVHGVATALDHGLRRGILADMPDVAPPARALLEPTDRIGRARHRSGRPHLTGRRAPHPRHRAPGPPDPNPSHPPGKDPRPDARLRHRRIDRPACHDQRTGPHGGPARAPSAGEGQPDRSTQHEGCRPVLLRPCGHGCWRRNRRPEARRIRVRSRVAIGLRRCDGRARSCVAGGGADPWEPAELPPRRQRPGSVRGDGGVSDGGRVGHRGARQG